MRAAAAVLIALGLAACGETHDVAWYRAHDTERAAKLAECGNHAGQDRTDADCLNARRAADPLGLRSRAMPSIGAPEAQP